MLQVDAAVLKLVNPKFSISVRFNGEVIQAALLKLAYVPKDPTINTPNGPKDPTVHARDFHDKLITGERWNWYQELSIRKSLQAWNNVSLPQYVVLVSEPKEGKFDFAQAVVVNWADESKTKDKLTITVADFQTLTVVATLSGLIEAGVYLTGTGAVEIQEEIEVTESEPVVEEVIYTGDPIRMEDGHYIGDDNFRVPNDFAEFFEWQPHYIRNWVKKRLRKQVVDDDVLDWEQELILHMKFLPENSKHRLPGANGRPDGCEDVVMTFNPYMQYGASERRFRNYVNNCLANKFMTLEAKEKKNPISKVGNFSLATQKDPECFDIVDDEYAHSHSEVLTRQAARGQKQHDDKLFCREYLDFVNTNDPTMLPVITAIAQSGTLGDAARSLKMSDPEFSRARNRLKQLALCFQQQRPVPKQRKQYKTRRTMDVMAEGNYDYGDAAIITAVD